MQIERHWTSHQGELGKRCPRGFASIRHFLAALLSPAVLPQDSFPSWYFPHNGQQCTLKLNWVHVFFYLTLVILVESLSLPDVFLFLGVYVCLIKVRQNSEELRQALSVADTSVYGWATLVSERSKNGMQRILIPFIPGFYMNQTELVISHKDIGELRVLGVERVLESLEVTAVLGTGV